MTSPGTVIHFSPTLHSHLTPYIAAIHAACITHDRTIATFLPPLSHEKLLTWWKDCIAEVKAGTRLIFLLVDNTNENQGSLSNNEIVPKGPDVMGVVMLTMAVTETGPMRGGVEKLLVHRSWRGKGGARVLMDELEREALKRGRTLMLLDTEVGSAAEKVYEKLGYTKLGMIPKYGKSPDGGFKDGSFWYKDLAA